MNVKIEVIPHKKQRYPTVGDWYFEKGNLVIRVSGMGNWRYEMLVAIHELAEVLMCKHDGISQKSVDKFDIAFENNRNPLNEDEPGDDPKAPYRKQHCIATGIERVLAAELGVSWNKYADAICKLP